MCGRRSATKPTARKAVTDRRYTAFFGCFHFNDGLYHRQVLAGAACRPPYNGVCGRRSATQTYKSARRSLTAATPHFFGCFHFNDGLYHRQVRRRERHAAPLQWRVRSAEYHKNLQVCKAVTDRRYTPIFRLFPFFNDGLYGRR